MNKRRHERMEVPNLTVDVSDGVGFFSGSVRDVSRVGMQLDDIPRKLNDQAKQLSVVISADGKTFKMLAIPKWIDGDNSRKRMGIKIIDAPWDWTEFIMKYEPVAGTFIH